MTDPTTTDDRRQTRGTTAAPRAARTDEACGSGHVRAHVSGVLS